MRKYSSASFSIVLIPVSGVLILIFMMGGEPWLNAPKVVAKGTVSEIISCEPFEETKTLCIAKIARHKKEPALWSIKISEPDASINVGQTVFKHCWYESVKDIRCFDNALIKKFGPWQNSRSI